MNWLRANKFLAIFAVCTVAALVFVMIEKGNYERAAEEMSTTTNELRRLQALNPAPTDKNLQKMKADAEAYAAALTQTKERLKTRGLPVAPLEADQFQARLRETINAVTAKARDAKVKLPDKFALGFEEYLSALPSKEAAPLLGQQLAQIELLVSLMIDAHVDGITALTRGPLSEEKPGTAKPSPAPGLPAKPTAAANAPTVKLLEKSSVDFTFASSPASARKVLNQIAANERQFFILRTVHVRNEKGKGPPREQAVDASAAAANPPPDPAPGKAGAKPGTPAAGLNFIVGTEHIQISAQIEIVRFTF